MLEQDYTLFILPFSLMKLKYENDCGKDVFFDILTQPSHFTKKPKKDFIKSDNIYDVVPIHFLLNIPKIKSKSY